MRLNNLNQLKERCLPHGLVYLLLSVIIVVLLVLTIVFGTRSTKTSSTSFTADNRIIGYPMTLPSNDRSIQWTFLHLNDVYELLPLDRGRKGGLARVAYIRKLLKQENDRTYTILAGDLLSPSALSISKVNGTALNGRQMIATMNTLGLDYMIFGNHEFDLTESDLLQRMNESKFTWISSNIFRKNSTQLFGTSISHQILRVESVRILLIGLTLDGTGSYVDIINQTSLVTYVQNFLNTFPNDTYDVLVAITHLDMSIDTQLAAKIPQIDLILGGHEHENYYYLRGTKYKPIYKADANAFTVYIHRCIFDIDRRQFDVFSTLARVTSALSEEEKTAEVAKYWFDLGIKGFEDAGYQPNQVVACLPPGLELDGRSESVRSSITLLTTLISESLVYMTKSNQTVIGIVNGGTVRIDDILRETITQYDVLRTLPFSNNIVALSVPGQILAQVLTTGISLKGNGMYLAYSGIETLDNGQTWLFNGTDITRTGLDYRIGTTGYLRENTLLNNPNVTILLDSDISQTNSFIEYMELKYPPC